MESRVRGHSLVAWGSRHLTHLGAAEQLAAAWPYNWQRWHCPGMPRLCGGSALMSERPHTVSFPVKIDFALGSFVIITSASGYCLPERLCILCTASTGKFWVVRSERICSLESSCGTPRRTARTLRSAGRA